MCCPTGFTASVTMASWPAAIGPAASHCPPVTWHARPSLVEPRQRRHRRRPRRRARRVEHLSLLRRPYDHHRDLRTRLPASAVAPPVNRARQLMTKRSCRLLPSLRLSDTDISPVTPTLSRWQPSAPPSPAKAQILQRHSAAPHQPKSPSRRSFTPRSPSKTTRRVNASH